MMTWPFPSGSHSYLERQMYLMLEDRSCSPLFASKDEGSRIWLMNTYLILKDMSLLSKLNWCPIPFQVIWIYSSDGWVADGHDPWNTRAQLDARHCICAWTPGFRQLVWTPSNAREDGSETMQCCSREYSWEEKAFVWRRLLWGLVYKYELVDLEPGPLWLQNPLLISPSVLSCTFTPSLCSFEMDKSVSHCFSQGCNSVVR